MLNTHIEADTVAKLQARVQELEHAVRTERMYRAKAKRRLKASKQLGVNVWQAAIDRELVAAHLGVAGPATIEEASKAIRELILWNIQAATSTVPVAPAAQGDALDAARDAVRAALASAAQSAAQSSQEAALHYFDSGWKAAARFCDREDVVADGIIGYGACPQFERAFDDARAAEKSPGLDCNSYHQSPRSDLDVTLDVARAERILRTTISCPLQK